MRVLPDPAGDDAGDFHLDHIIPLAAGGATEFENLCLSCPFCNEFKAGRWRARDPRTGRQVRLFNPRRDHWQNTLSGARMVRGLSVLQRVDAPPLPRCA
jgi:5-methylcytosine-specific restriction endonuclease McrA